MTAAPDSGNDYLAEHADLLMTSYHRLTGRNLLLGERVGGSNAEVLFAAPYAVVSHTSEDDPIFNYGNRKALELFEMDWNAFTQLPSRLSAEPLNREDRQRLLQQVAMSGYIDNYRGVRISSSGQRFRIDDSTVWNVFDEYGNDHGQAAVIFRWAIL